MEDYPRTRMELERRFATDEACGEYLAQLRWPPASSSTASWSKPGRGPRARRRDSQGRTGPAQATASQPVVGTGVKGIPPKVQVRFWLGVVVSLARALGFIASAWLLLYVALPQGIALDLPMALNVVLAWASGAVLQGLGLSVARSGALLAMGNGAVRVADVCNGVGEWLLLVGAMFAIPKAGWRHRLLGMVTGGLVLSTLNIARISLLLVLRADAPAWFGVAHEQFMPLAVVLAIIGCFAVWLRRLPREMAAGR